MPLTAKNLKATQVACGNTGRYLVLAQVALCKLLTEDEVWQPQLPITPVIRKEYQ